MPKQNGILLAVLLLATFALAFSSAASAQTPQAPPAAQTVQPAAPLPSFLTAPAATQTPAVAPANGSSTLEWKASCTCSTDAVCVPYGMECCLWPKQTCGICC